MKIITWSQKARSGNKMTCGNHVGGARLHGISAGMATRTRGGQAEAAASGRTPSGPVVANGCRTRGGPVAEAATLEMQRAQKSRKKKFASLRPRRQHCQRRSAGTARFPSAARPAQPGAMCQMCLGHIPSLLLSRVGAQQRHSAHCARSLSSGCAQRAQPLTGEANRIMRHWLTENIKHDQLINDMA
jgi:hypothetical protein